MTEKQPDIPEIIDADQAVSDIHSGDQYIHEVHDGVVQGQESISPEEQKSTSLSAKMESVSKSGRFWNLVNFCLDSVAEGVKVRPKGF